MTWWLIITAVLLVALLVATAALLRARRRRLAPPPPVPRHPLVLIHGIMGFDKLDLPGWKPEYFRGVASHLEKQGATVYRPRLPPLSSVPERARALVDYLRELPAEKVNVLAHSMAGLDARYAIAKLGAGQNIASVITIGTPHFGTPVADLKDWGPAALGRKVAGKLGLDLDGLDWLTVDSANNFNAEITDDPQVFYGCVLCRARDNVAATNPLLIPPLRFLRERAGSSDGLVPAASQRWGEVLIEVEADHWAEIGWSVSFDALPLYDELLRELAARRL
jgi:triacylglycerol lipase